jgi:hypothetical protein
MPEWARPPLSDSPGPRLPFSHRWRIAGKSLVLRGWGSHPRNWVVKECLRNGVVRLIHREQLPGYAPELNSAEGFWNFLNQEGLKDLCYQNISHLCFELRNAK